MCAHVHVRTYLLCNSTGQCKLIQSIAATVAGGWTSAPSLNNKEISEYPGILFTALFKVIRIGCGTYNSKQSNCTHIRGVRKLQTDYIEHFPAWPWFIVLSPMSHFHLEVFLMDRKKPGHTCNMYNFEFSLLYLLWYINDIKITHGTYICK